MNECIKLTITTAIATTIAAIAIVGLLLLMLLLLLLTVSTVVTTTTTAEAAATTALITLTGLRVVSAAPLEATLRTSGTVKCLVNANSTSVESIRWISGLIIR